MNICDDCGLIAYDNSFDDGLMAEIGADIEDHICINHEEPELVASGEITRCDCACSNKWMMER
jgi:hypothetical protein|tara:strand:+ start:433 stop:621 length:189 start_codon:yes stop_codon:yes gene_type:complete